MLRQRTLGLELHNKIAGWRYVQLLSIDSQRTFVVQLIALAGATVAGFQKT